MCSSSGQLDKRRYIRNEKKEASAIDTQEQMMRMKTNRVPAVSRLNVFFRDEDRFNSE